MNEGDKCIIRGIKNKTIGVLEEIGYIVNYRMIVKDNYWVGGCLMDDGSIKLEYFDLWENPYRADSQFEFRDKARKAGLEVNINKTGTRGLKKLIVERIKKLEEIKDKL